MPLDPKSLPKEAETLKKIVLDLAEQLDRVAGERDRESSEKNKYAEMIRELLEAQRARRSEKLSAEQSGLFEELWRKAHPAEDSEDPTADALPESPVATEKKRAARRPLARHITRERIVHDLPEAEKHCGCCGRDPRLIAEETSERYEYIPASLKVIEDVRRRYACPCTVKAAEKPAQPIEKSTAGASLLAHIIVAKWPTISRCTDSSRCWRGTVWRFHARRWADGSRSVPICSKLSTPRRRRNYSLRT